ncbi:MAG: hypothetical protein ABSG05_00685 [Candidatus Pacearchaeota archaeon]|jgi:hypothetical protein
MVTPSRVRMNKLRHKHGMIAKEKQAENEENKSWRERSSKSISQEEHQERLNKLKEIGLLK